MNKNIFHTYFSSALMPPLLQVSLTWRCYYGLEVLEPRLNRFSHSIPIIQVPAESNSLMSNVIRASVVQSCTAAYSLSGTLDKLEHYAQIAKGDHAQLVVFPEALSALFELLTQLLSLLTSDNTCFIMQHWRLSENVYFWHSCRIKISGRT